MRVGLSLALAVSAIAIAAVPIQAAQSTASWDDVWEMVRNPCRAVEIAMRAHGISPWSANPRHRYMRQAAWTYMAPAVAALAYDEHAARDPQAALERIVAQFDPVNARTYSSAAGAEAWQQVFEVGSYALAALDRGEAVPGGWLVLAAVIADGDLRAAWQSAFRWGSVPSSMSRAPQCGGR